jgi:hypothetical protein
VSTPISDAARAANLAACDCMDERRFVEAIPHAREAARLAPGWAAPWLNLSVAYKHAGRWPEVLDAVDRAVALGASPEALAGVQWNAGIAATALGAWPRARAAWAAAGVRLPDGTGPIELALGKTPIRVALDGAPEVVWCDRIDPCRAWIASIPLPESGRRYRDLLHHDGEPRGKRALVDRMVSVFDELAVLEPSRHRTWEATVRAPRPVVVGALFELFEGTDVAVEDWTEQLETMCKACSLGTPHAHQAPGPRMWETQRRLAFATTDEAALAPLRRRREVLALRLLA